MVWCLKPFAQYFSYIVVVSFIGGGNRRKPQTWSRDKLYHMMLYRVHLAWAGFELTTLLVIGTDCIGSLRANHYTITLPLREELYKRYINTCTQYTVIGQKSQLLISTKTQSLVNLPSFNYARFYQMLQNQIYKIKYIHWMVYLFCVQIVRYH